MQIVLFVLVLALGYIAGALPFGWLYVKMKTGKDVRTVASGRIGGTNASRAAGPLVGVVTAVSDFAKGYFAPFLAVWLLPADSNLLPWAMAGAALLSILGHNYSIFMITRSPETGKLRLNGGAGGATCLGASVGLWSLMFAVLPLVLIVYFFIGYASLTTLSIAVFSFAAFLIQALLGNLPWAFVWYGLGASIAVAWALRPNLARLVRGEERLTGLRAKNAKKNKTG